MAAVDGCADPERTRPEAGPQWIALALALAALAAAAQDDAGGNLRPPDPTWAVHDFQESSRPASLSYAALICFVRSTAAA